MKLIAFAVVMVLALAAAEAWRPDPGTVHVIGAVPVHDDVPDSVQAEAWITLVLEHERELEIGQGPVFGRTVTGPAPAPPPRRSR